MSKKKKLKETKQLQEDDVDASDSPEIKTKADKKEKPKANKKKDFKIWSTFNVYRFLIEILAAVFLVTLGVVILVNKDDAMIAIYIIIAVLTLLLMLFRLIVLIKTRKTDPKKSISYKIIIIEFVIQFIVSILFIIAAVATYKIKSSDSKALENISEHFDKYFAPYTALILYSASVSFFVRAIIFQESDNSFICIVNIVYITIAILLCAFKDELTTKTFVVLVALFAILVAILASIDAGGSFYNYSQNNNKGKKKQKKEEKKDEKEDEDDIELPSETPIIKKDEPEDNQEEIIQ